MKRWYAIYTRSRAEKIVFDRLVTQDVDVYLPMQKKLKYWSDRKKWVEEPLLRSYIFVSINPDKEYFKIMNTDGVVCFIKFENRLTAIPEKQMDALKSLVKSGMTYEVTNENYSLGDYVQIMHGEMRGYAGHLLEHRGKYNVLIELENIRQSIILNIPAEYLRKIQHDTMLTSYTGQRKLYKGFV